MVTLEDFRKMTKSLDKGILSDLCEQFVYDHEGAMQETMRFASQFGLELNCMQVKNFITEMHLNGDFDDVECWGLPLGCNDLYKKFHS